jgi:hypothetical protein
MARNFQLSMIATTVVFLCNSLAHSEGNWRFHPTSKRGEIALSADGIVTLKDWIASPISDARRQFRVIWTELSQEQYRTRVQEVKKTDLLKYAFESAKCAGDLAMVPSLGW